MEAILAKADLARALKFAQKGSDPKSAVPAIACLHVRVDGAAKTFHVEGSDLYTTTGVTVPIESSHESGEALLPNLFADYGNMMPDGMVRLVSRSEVAPSVVLESVAQKRRFSAQSIPAADWPVDKMTRADKAAPSVSLPAKVLLEMLPTIIPVMGDDESHPTNSATIRLNGNRLEGVSSDGSRLQICRYDVADHGSIRLVTNKRNLRLMRRMLEADTSATEMLLSVTENTFLASVKDYTLQGRVTSDFGSIDPMLNRLAWNSRLRFAKESFVTMVEACALESSYDIVLTLHRDGTMKLGAKLEGKVRVIDEVTPEEVIGLAWSKDVDSFDVGVSHRFLREAFTAVPGTDAILCIGAPSDPLLVTSPLTDFTKHPREASHLSVIAGTKL